MAKNKNEKMEIMMNGTTFQIGNKELGKNLKSILSEMAKMHKSSWNYARSYSNIIRGELWKGDFERQKDFAQFMGVTNGAISQLVGAVDFIDGNRDRFNEENITVTNAYLLKTVTVKDENDKKVSATKDFIEWLEENGYTINAGTPSKRVKEWIKRFKDELNAIDTEGVETDITNEVQNPETESKEAETERYNMFNVQTKIVDGHPVYMVTETIYGTSENGEDFKEVQTKELTPTDFVEYLSNMAEAVKKCEQFRIKNNKLAEELKNR